jgi:thiosulfate/3-mercaptopyruvate sulfurtransferase
MRFTTFISTAELSSHLDNPSWAVIDCRFDLDDPEKGEREYLDSHIPGALYAHLDRDLAAPASPALGRHPLPDTHELVNTFSQWGIDSDVQVVAYDNRGGGFAARLWWMLRYLSHEKVAVLSGGFPAWEKMGLPLRSGRETRPPRTFRANVQPHMLATAKDVLTQIGQEEMLLVDSRAPERYRGEEEPFDPIAGHIPGAQNHFWQKNLDADGHIRRRKFLHDEWEQVLSGKTPDRAIFYCGSGVTACLNLLSMAHAGFEGAKLFVGSWSQWSHNPDLPKKTGDSILEGRE